MIFNQQDYKNQLPLPPTAKWKEGIWDIEAFRHGTMSLVYFAPEGTDHQTPHDQDELYFVLEGSGVIDIEGQDYTFAPGAAIFVKAGQYHRFKGSLSGIRMWAVFYGRNGGEAVA